MADSERNNSQAALVGRLIKSYRSGAGRNGRGLTQEGLLSLMVERGENYAVRLDRSTISHWERGVRLAPQEFLEALGRALDVPQGEIRLMMVLAGHVPPPPDFGVREEILTAVQSIESRVGNVQQDMRSLMGSSTVPTPSANTSTVVRGALQQAVLPGVYALTIGFVLNAIGLNGTAVLLAYALVAASIVTGQWVLRWLKTGRETSAQDNIAGLFFISLFVTLNSSVLIGAATKADHFGFYTISSFTNTSVPFVLTMVVNLALALAGVLIFSLLWRSQNSPDGGRSTFTRAVFITLPPILFVYVNIIVFTNFGGWIYFMIVLGVMFGAFTAIVAFNEPGLKLGNDGFALKATILVIVLLCSVGVASLIIVYMEPDMLMTAADFRIVSLPEVSHTELGYTAQEGVERVRLGMMFMSLTTILYMAIVVGGYLIMTVRRATA